MVMIGIIFQRDYIQQKKLLENIDNIKNVIDNNPNKLINFIFGDIYHPSVIKDSTKFINKKINKNINKIIMEISSRKIMYYNNLPLNHFYSQRSQRIKHKYNLVEKIFNNLGKKITLLSTRLDNVYRFQELEVVDTIETANLHMELTTSFSQIALKISRQDLVLIIHHLVSATLARNARFYTLAIHRVIHLISFQTFLKYLNLLEDWTFLIKFVSSVKSYFLF